jgi:hypothetical protein
MACSTPPTDSWTGWTVTAPEPEIVGTWALTDRGPRCVWCARTIPQCGTGGNPCRTRREAIEETRSRLNQLEA